MCSGDWGGGGGVIYKDNPKQWKNAKRVNHSELKLLQPRRQWGQRHAAES